MSLDKAAKYLEAHGRNGDSMLVHMSPGEVQSLQTLAKASGGSLSINPHTGLAEAGWLKNLLPAVAGAALTAATGGAAAPWMIGLGYGAFETARTGDLSKGLMAGLGAYGGAGLGSAAGLGASSATPAASGAGTGISTAGGAGAGTAVTPTASGGLGATQSSFGLNPAATGGASGISAPAGSLYTPNLSAAAGPSGTQMFKYGMSAAAPVLADASQPKVEDPYAGPLGKYSLSSNYQAFDPMDWRRRNIFAEGGSVQQSPQTNFFPQSNFDQSQYATPTQRPASQEVINADFDTAVSPYTGNPTMMAEGGKAKAKATPERTIDAMDAYQGALARLNNARHNANMSQFDMPKANISGLGVVPYVATAAQGGTIGGYSDGGQMLKGPGDGMSDSIPGVIGSKQPARLADGEFVVPADVVSHLGNGSTDAGAKRLYSMMDKVRHARTGSKKQGKEIKADKYLPS